MILYTTMPQEIVFPTDETAYGKQIVIDYNGCSMLVQQSERNSYQIVRNMSTNPYHYLQEEYSPGQSINYQ